MVASNKDWTMRNPPSLEPFGILALLSVLIAVPAFLMIGVLEPGLVRMHSAFCFSRKQPSPPSRPARRV